MTEGRVVARLPDGRTISWIVGPNGNHVDIRDETSPFDQLHALRNMMSNNSARRRALLQDFEALTKEYEKMLDDLRVIIHTIEHLPK